MATVYGGSVPPGLTAPTRGELKIRIDRLSLHQELLVEVPLLRPYLKSTRHAGGGPDGSGAGEGFVDSSESMNDANGVARDPLELKALLDKLEESFAIAPLFWGEDRSLAECKEPMLDRPPTAAISARSPLPRPPSTTIICPVKTLQSQLSQYLHHSAMSPLKGLPLHLILPASKLGKKAPLVVGTATLSIAALTPSSPVGGWFSIISTNEKGELFSVGRVKAHVSVNFTASSSSSPAGAGEGAASPPSALSSPTPASSPSSAPNGSAKGSGAASASGPSSALPSGAANYGSGSRGAATSSSKTNTSSSNVGVPLPQHLSAAEGASDHTTTPSGQQQHVLSGRPPLGPINSSTHVSFSNTTSSSLANASSAQQQQQQGGSSSSSGRSSSDRRHQHTQQQQQQLAQHQQRQRAAAALEASTNLLVPHPSPLDPSPSFLQQQQLQQQKKRLEDIMLKGQQLRDELSLAANRSEGGGGGAADASAAAASEGFLSEELADVYRRHAPSLLANAAMSADGSGSVVQSAASGLTAYSGGSGSGGGASASLSTGASKGFTTMGTVGEPTGVEHRLLHQQKGGSGGRASSRRDRNHHHDARLSRENDFVSGPIHNNDDDSLCSSFSSSSSSSAASDFGYDHQDGVSFNEAGRRQHHNHHHHNHVPAPSRKVYSHRQCSEVHLNLSDFSFATTAVEEIRVQLRLSKDVSCPTPFEALSSFVYYLPPPTAENVASLGTVPAKSNISIPLHFTVSSFTSESRLVIECYSVHSREAPLSSAASRIYREQQRNNQSVAFPSPPPPRVVESEELIGVLFLGLYTAAPRLVQFHDPITGRNPVEAVAEVRVMKSAGAGGVYNGVMRRQDARSSVDNDDGMADDEAGGNTIIASQQQTVVGNTNRGASDTNASPLQFNGSSYKQQQQHGRSVGDASGVESSTARRKERSHSSDDDSSSCSSMTSSASSSSSSGSSDSSRRRRRRRGRNDKRKHSANNGKIVIYSDRDATADGGGAAATTTTTVTVNTTRNGSSPQQQGGGAASFSSHLKAEQQGLAPDGSRLILDPNCPLHGPAKVAARAVEEMKRAEAEAQRALAASIPITRLHVSLRQAKGLPSVQIYDSNAEEAANKTNGKGGAEGSSSSSGPLYGASMVVAQQQQQQGHDAGSANATVLSDVADPAAVTPLRTSDGTLAQAPHAFLVIEDFLYADAPTFESLPLPPSSAADKKDSPTTTAKPSTAFRDFMERVEAKKAATTLMSRVVGCGEKDTDGEDGAKAVNSVTAEWRVDGVVRGHYDRTLVAESSHKPVFNYEASVAVQHPPSSRITPSNASATGAASPSSSYLSPSSSLPLSGMLVSLWHAPPADEASARRNERKGKHGKGGADANEGDDDLEEEARFWQRASRIGTAFVDLKGLKYLSTVEGWFKCYSDHHSIDTPVGFLQLSVRKL